MSAEYAPVRIVLTGWREQYGRRVTEVNGAFPSVNDIGVSGRHAGVFNPAYGRSKDLYSPILLALLTETPGTEFEMIKPGTKSTKLILPINRDGELPHPMGSVLLEGRCVWPTRQTRDQGNWVTIIAKFVGDVLQAGGWLSNDDWTRYLVGNFERGLNSGKAPYTELVFLPAPEPLALIDEADREEALF